MTEISRLHDDHAALQPHVDAIRATADQAGTATAAALRPRFEAIRAFVDSDLLPHMMAEDEVLYPALQEVLGSSHATVGMEHDHVQIRKAIGEMAEIEADLASVETIPGEMATRIRRVLYGLYALLVTHFDKEEHLYLPHLRRALDARETETLVARMESAIARLKGQATSP